MNLDDLAAELYASAPEEFVARRDALAARARAAGDAELAAAVKRLRKPTTGAWALNQLARRRVSDVQRLLELGEALRRAQGALAGDDVRELSRQRQEVIATLTGDARAHAEASGHGLSGAVLDEVTATLEAAGADGEVAEALRSGRLVTTARGTSGFEAATLTGPTARSGRPRSSGAGRREAGDRQTAARAERAYAEAGRARAKAEREVAVATRRVHDAEARLAELRDALRAATERARAARDQEERARRDRHR